MAIKKRGEKDILKTLIDISGFMNFVDTPELVLSLIIEECVLSTGARWGVILSYDNDLASGACRFSKVMDAGRRAGTASRLSGLVRRLIDDKKREMVIKFRSG